MADKVYGIIGHPVGHTLSPMMHNRAAGLLGLPYSYVAFDVPPEKLKTAIGAVRSLGIFGLNITVPHKERVITYLDRIEEEALLIGAVNTISLINGQLTGTNTDGLGFIRSLKMEGFNPRKKKVALIGAGGSARAIGVSLCRAGISEIVVINRSTVRGKRLAGNLNEFGEAWFVPAEDSKKVQDAINRCDLVVQTTPCGMKKKDPLPISARFSKGQWVYDIIYSPWQTRFLAKAGSGGARTINGLGMLIYQGSESFRIWTGKPFPEGKILEWMKKSVSGE